MHVEPFQGHKVNSVIKAPGIKVQLRKSLADIHRAYQGDTPKCLCYTYKN